MSDTIAVISDIARKAGRIQMECLGRALRIEYKGVIDIVTDVDRRCEEMILSELGRHFPGDEILAEEGGVRSGNAARRWIVDPLDGTVNFAHGFPFFCVSIALEEDGELAAGAIFDPNRDELFTAEKGKGAQLNGKRMQVSTIPELNKAMLATGFAYNVREVERLDNLDNFGNFVKRACAVRRPGSAAIDLAWLACGRIDGFWELFLKPWDIAAGVLIIREAGGRVTSFNGGPLDIFGTEILASNGLIHEEMQEVLKIRESCIVDRGSS